ncbi:MAG TPA: DegT/DnrJ/EryC1/StrS family aminotransferase [Coleofasciculaceae cyanobacterium]|jgi:dTDP-4-amino-4,6-dideoxygalactose transaminase
MDTAKRSIPIAKPTVTDGVIELMEEALNSGWVSMGPLTQRFEQLVCDYTGAKHAVAMNSCTSAIHIAMLAHGIGPGDEVLCPSYSFIATANGIRHAGAEPRFVDIDPETLNMDPGKAEELIRDDYTPELRHRKSGRTLKGILLVHQVGLPADIDAFAELARKYNLVLMEDNACGLGSTYKGQPLGCSGYTSMLSFHPRKVITSGEGGMLLTDNEAIAEKARVLRAHGMSISDLVRHNASSTLYESYEVVGYNYRLTDLQAALGIRQMEHIEDFIQRRCAIAARYNEAFSGFEEIALLAPPDYVTRWNYQSYPIRLLNGNREIRDRFMQTLHEAGISTRRGIPPIHQEPVYAQNLTLPNTKTVSETSLFLPIYPTMSDDDVDYVIEHARKAIAQWSSQRSAAR